jgi:hypothetical protein
MRAISADDVVLEPVGRAPGEELVEQRAERSTRRSRSSRAALDLLGAGGNDGVRRKRNHALRDLGPGPLLRVEHLGRCRKSSSFGTPSGSDEDVLPGLRVGGANDPCAGARCCTASAHREEGARGAVVATAGPADRTTDRLPQAPRRTPSRGRASRREVIPPSIRARRQSRVLEVRAHLAPRAEAREELHRARGSRCRSLRRHVSAGSRPRSCTASHTLAHACRSRRHRRKPLYGPMRSAGFAACTRPGPAPDAGCRRSAGDRARARRRTARSSRARPRARRASSAFLTRLQEARSPPRPARGRAAIPRGWGPSSTGASPRSSLRPRHRRIERRRACKLAPGGRALGTVLEASTRSHLPPFRSACNAGVAVQRLGA